MLVRADWPVIGIVLTVFIWFVRSRPSTFAKISRWHNRELLNDVSQNIFDDYCALMAATELYSATTITQKEGRRRYLRRPIVLQLG
jgi:hypothetical protein